MGNHHAICPHCGKDQRKFGVNCCQQAVLNRQHERAEFRGTQQDRRALLDLHGIRHSDTPSHHFRGEWEVVAEPDSLFEFLFNLPVPFTPSVPRDDSPPPQPEPIRRSAP